MEIQEPSKTGFLFTPPQSFLRKSWAKRFCAMYHASSHGIQRLEIFENDVAFLQSKSPMKIVPLTDCIKVTPAPQKQQANVFEVRTKTCCQQFSADSFQEMTEWLSTLRSAAFGPSCVPIGLSNLIPSQDVKQEENTLYSSVHEPEVYSVQSLNTDAMIRNNIVGHYKLIVTSTHISVAEVLQNKILLTWPYRHIRRYGCSKDNFSFEAGRKCASGEGLFAFSTPDGRAIFQSVDSHVSRLKYSCNEAPPSPFTDDKNCNLFTYKDDFEKQSGGHSVSNFIFGTSHDGESTYSSEKKSTVLETNAVKSEKATSGFKLPVSKPPRKSKENSDANNKIDHGKNSDSQVNVYHNMYEDAESFSGPCCSDTKNNQCKDISVDVISKFPGSFKPRVENSLNISEPVYAVLEENAFSKPELTSRPEEHHQSYENVSVGSFSNNSDVQLTNSDEHFSVKKLNSKHFSLNSLSDHIYGKLITNRPSSVSNSNPSTYTSSSINKKVCAETVAVDNSHPYSNVAHSSNISESSVNDPKHFLRNNAEYAKVFKSKN